MASSRVTFLRYALLIILCGGLLIEWARYRMAPPVTKATASHEMSVRERLVGTWVLVSATDRMKDGTERPYPVVGKNGKGYLMYTADGHMCVELMNPEQANWKDLNSPTEAEMVAMINGFVAYCGKYEIDEAAKTIVHLPEVASAPNLLGTRQPRPYTFHGDEMTFAGKTTGEPGVESYTITWRRAEGKKNE